MRSADMSSTREVVPTMPALLTSAPSVPNSSAALNSARMSCSLPTSHCTAIALPFLPSMVETTSRAAASLVAYPTQTRNPREAAASAVARPIHRPPPVIMTTLSVKTTPNQTSLLEQPYQHREQRKNRNEPNHAAGKWNLDQIQRHIENAHDDPHLRAERAKAAVTAGHDKRHRQGGEDGKSFQQ